MDTKRAGFVARNDIESDVSKDYYKKYGSFTENLNQGGYHRLSVFMDNLLLHNYQDCCSSCVLQITKQMSLCLYPNCICLI